MVTRATGPFGDSQILDCVVRMVVPMRREFGRQLDVQQFMRDRDYAHTLIAEALTSRDARLVEYAQYVSQRLLSARVAAAPPQAPKADTSAPPAVGSSAEPTKSAGQTLEDELRNRVMDKYRRGLR
ncbi:MAG: hypothetical protein ACK5WT_04125 [Betaproteobacteria bacterium]